MEKRFEYKETLDSAITNGRLTKPNPGVAYVQETDMVYFNNVVLPNRIKPQPELELVEDVAMDILKDKTAETKR